MKSRSRSRCRIGGLMLAPLALVTMTACEEGPDITTPNPSVEQVRAPAMAVLPDFGGESTTGIPLQTVPELSEGTAATIDNSELVFGTGASALFNLGVVSRKSFVWDGTQPAELETTDRFTSVDDANENGVAVGTIFFSSGARRGLRWDAADGLVQIQAPSPNFLGGDPQMKGIDDAGNAVGWYLSGGTPSLRSFYFDGTTGTSTDMGRPSFTPSSPLANDIEDGMAVGGAGFIPFSWTPSGGFVALQGDGSALATNGSQIVGNVDPPSGGAIQAALLSAEAAPVFLGTLGGYSIPTDINAQGWVVGSSEDASGDERAFLWTPETGMIDLGALPGETESFANSINDAGLIAGGSGGQAVIWKYEPAGANEAPVIETIISQTATVGEEFTLTPVVTDAEEDPYTLSWSGDIPESAATNGIFFMTPTATDIGSYEITVTATQDDDPTLSDSETFVLSVLPAEEFVADVQVSLALQNATRPLVGDVATYIATITNNGSQTVDVTLVGEREFPLQSEWGELPPTFATNGIFFSNVGPVPAGGTLEVPFEIVFGAMGVQEMAARVEGEYADPNPDNDRSALDQVVDLSVSYPGVDVGSLTVPESLTLDGEPLTLVGVDVPPELIADNSPAVFFPASLVRTDPLQTDVLLAAEEISPDDAFLAGSYFAPRNQVISGEGFDASERFLPDDEFSAGDRFVLRAGTLAGRIIVPPTGDWSPRGDIRLRDEVGGTDATVVRRVASSPALGIDDDLDGGLAVTVLNGTAELSDVGLEMCDGIFDVTLDLDDSGILTCGSLTVETLTGEIRVDLDDGTVVIVPAGNTARIFLNAEGRWEADVLAGDGVVVLPPASYGTLQQQIDDLRDEGILNRGLHRALSVKVTQSGRLEDRGKFAESEEVLMGLRTQVGALRSAEIIPAGDAAALIATIDQLLSGTALPSG